MSLIALAFDTGLRRQPDGRVGLAIKIYAGLVTAWVIWAAGFSREDALSLTITFLAMMLVLTFLLITPGANSDPRRTPWYEWLMAALSFACGLYFVSQAEII
ncbi:MAG: hypothetical protein RJQ21_20590, partial [Rhodospirillales bacterium]